MNSGRPESADRRQASAQRARLAHARGVAPCLVALTVATPSAQRPGTLPAGPQIARAYDAIFDAQFEQVPALLAQTCPPAPAEVCTLLDLVYLWWQIQVDPENRSRDARLLARADAAVSGIEIRAKG